MWDSDHNEFPLRHLRIAEILAPIRCGCCGRRRRAPSCKRLDVTGAAAISR
jgi:hypothetical protein